MKRPNNFLPARVLDRIRQVSGIQIPHGSNAPQERRKPRLKRELGDVVLLSTVLLLIFLVDSAFPQQPGSKKADPPAAPPKPAAPSSYDQIAPVLLGQETFQARMAKDKADKAATMARQLKLLEERYDLKSHPDKAVAMSRGKPIQVGPTAKLPDGMTWQKLADLPAAEIREKGLFPKGFLPLPHPKHEVGGMVFPQMMMKQFPRLERFDIDFDLPEHFLPEFPPAIFLSTRPDLGDVSRGKVVTVGTRRRTSTTAAS
jgi:hypothetical protein